jgi:aldose 1-epimerase
MSITRKVEGRTTDGQIVERWHLGADGIAVSVLTYGATLASVEVPDARGRTADVTVGLPSLAAYQDRRANPYLGCTMGRFCRIVAKGDLTIGSSTHQLDRNAGQHHLHGGREGLDRRVWQADAAQDGDDLVVVLTLVSPDGDQGYPGELRVSAEYRVLPPHRLRWTYVATTDAPTLVGLTNHAWWNLAGGGPVDGHLLQVAAPRVVPTDREHVPTGGPVPAAARRLDYRAPRPLQGQQLDACFALCGQQPAARLVSPASGRWMEVETDQPGLAVYTGDGHPITPRAGICLQTTAWPDAPHHATFPSAVLHPGQTYHHTTTHIFGVAPLSGSGAE